MNMKALSLILVCLLPIVVRAQNALSYTTNSGTITVTGYIGSQSGVTNVVIPASINAYPVVAIRNQAFVNCSNLKSVTIPTSMRTIGLEAFYACGLTNVLIPASVTNIDVRPFAACHSLTNISVDAANPAYSSLNGVLFDKAQTALFQFPAGDSGGYAMPASVTKIGNGAFDFCSSLTSVTIGDSVTNIDHFAFAGCVSLTSVTIPASVKSLGYYAFENCTSLTNFTFLGNAPALGLSVFLNDTGTVYYYSGTIGWGATYGGLPTVMLIGTLPSNPLTYTTNSGAITITGFVGPSSGVTNVVIPDSINGYPVVAIGNYAFYHCTNMPSVVIGNNVNSIGSGAFSSCYNLTNLMIPNSVTSIGAGAFDSCYKLSNISIPASVTSIGSPPFASCYALTNISVDAANAAYSSLSGVLFNKAQTTLVQFPPGLSGDYFVPSSVTSIATVAFGTCSGLTSVVLPNSLTNIGSFAFSICSGLTSMVIPDSVVNIKSSTFQGCAGLTNVVFGNAVTNIGNNAFSSCANLTSVTIPASVVSVGNSTYSSCLNLTNLTFLGNTPSLGTNTFTGTATGATVYYYYGTTGWGTTYGGLPAYMLGAPAPQIGGGGSIEVQSGHFSFEVSGIINQTVVVEACTNLVNWQPVWTNTLTTATANFTDPQWANFPARYYRAR